MSEGQDGTVYTITVRAGTGYRWEYELGCSKWKGRVVAPAVGDHIDAIHAAAQHLRMHEADRLPGGRTG